MITPTVPPTPIVPADLSAPGNATTPPKKLGNGPQQTFEVKLRVNQDEVEQAIALLREGGMDQFADLLQNALPKPDASAMGPEAQSLQDEIVAMQPRQ